MEVYFIRHGQRGFFHNYDALLPEGIWQSIQVGKYFKNKKINILYCSPQKRAKESLHYLMPRRKPIITEKLRQQAVPREVDKAIQLLHERDTPEQLTRRVKSFLDSLKKKHKKDVVLCMTHKLFIEEVALQLTGKNKEIPSASITYLKFKNDELVKSFFGKRVYRAKNPNFLRDAFLKASKKLDKEQVKTIEKRALEVAKKGGSRNEIAKAYSNTFN